MTRANGKRRVRMSTPNQPINETPQVDANGTVDIEFFNPHDGVKGRDGGPYLDHVLRQEAEIHRAYLEGRDPADLDGILPATAGSPLVVKARLVDNSIMSNPSMATHPGFDVQPVITAQADTRVDASEVTDENSQVAIDEPVSEPVTEQSTESTDHFNV